MKSKYYYKKPRMLYTMTPLLRWRPTKIGLTSFNGFAPRFLSRLTQATMEENVTQVHNLISAGGIPIEGMRDS